MVNKRQLRRSLARERRLITRRLDKAVVVNPDGPLQTWWFWDGWRAS